MNNAENTRALMLHIMKMKQQQHAIGDAIKRSITWYRHNNASEKAAKSDIVQMTETRIYIGLNDGETGEQLYETEKYLEQMKEICRKYQVPFSVDVEEGGYYHEDGMYTEETSLVLLLIEADPDVVKGIAKELCVLFHQESVLVTENQLGGYFITQESNEP